MLNNNAKPAAIRRKTTRNTHSLNDGDNRVLKFQIIGDRKPMSKTWDSPRDVAMNTCLVGPFVAYNDANHAAPSAGTAK